MVKKLPEMQETKSLIPGMGRSPGEGNSNPLQYSCLEDPHGQRRLVGYSPCGHQESDTTESLSTHALCLYKLNIYLKMKIFWRNFSHQLQILFSLKFLSFNEEIYDSE